MTIVCTKVTSLKENFQCWKNPDSVGKNRTTWERTGQLFGSRLSGSFQPPCIWSVHKNGAKNREAGLPTVRFWLLVSANPEFSGDYD